jgi:hypothetical protein
MLIMISFRPDRTLVIVHGHALHDNRNRGVPLQHHERALAVIFAPGAGLFFEGDRFETGIPRRTQVFSFQQTSLIKGGAVMPKRAHLVLYYLKLVTFVAVWIALLWSVWRLLS